jgi:D-3-phosphoglycerate dehydrogenase
MTARPHVHLGQEIHPDALALLEEGAVVHRGYGPDREQLEGLLDVLDAMVVRYDGVSADTLRRASRLRVVARAGVGYENVPVDVARNQGIPVYITAGANSRSVAEHVFALALALVKDVVRWDRVTRQRPDDLGVIREQGLSRMLTGARLGLLGVGGIGSQVASIGVGGFGMHVLAYHPSRIEHPIQRLGVRLTQSLDELLGWADMVSVQVPLTDATRGMLGAREFSLMQPHAVLINVSRGDILDEAALADALANGRPGGAGLDVWEGKLPARDNPLLASPHTVCTPHRAGRTEDAQRRLGVLAVTAVLDVLAGRSPSGVIDITDTDDAATVQKSQTQEASG